VNRLPANSSYRFNRVVLMLSIRPVNSFRLAVFIGQSLAAPPPCSSRDAAGSHRQCIRVRVDSADCFCERLDSMSGIFFWIYVSAAVILLFGAAVFVHEWGHYFMALKRKMKVEAFAIGFGPKIFGWKKNGIDYSWRWIPAGGFVRIPQMVTS
jgi:hypothetical protein